MPVGSSSVAVAILGLHPNGFCALDVGVDARDGKTTFLANLLTRPRHDLGVDIHPGVVTCFADVEHQQLNMAVDLGRCQANAIGLVHGFQHVVDQLSQRFVEVGDRFCAGAKPRVGKFEDFESGHKFRVCWTI